MLDAGERAGAGAAVESADEHVVRVSFGDTRGHRANPGFRDELDAHSRMRVDPLQVVDELGEVLDRVDVMVRRRRNERGAWNRVT